LFYFSFAARRWVPVVVLNGRSPTCHSRTSRTQAPQTRRFFILITPLIPVTW
jgi:hypothetical protein